MNVRLHRATPADGVTGEQQKAAEAFDLVKLLLAILTAHLNPIFLDQKWHQFATVAFAISLNPANLVKKRRQYPRVRIAHAGKGIGRMRFHVGVDQ